MVGWNTCTGTYPSAYIYGIWHPCTGLYRPKQPKTIIVPKEIKLYAAKFNTNLKTTQQPIYKLKTIETDELINLQSVKI